MNRAVAIVAVVTAVLVGLYAAYSWAFPTETLRYRLTLTLNVNGNASVGSGVIQVTRQDTTGFFKSIGGFGHQIKGEAIAVDIDGRGTLFALLRGPNAVDDKASPANVIFAAFQELLSPTADPIEWMRALRIQKPKRQLSTPLLPLLVYFRTESDPLSVEVVNPSDLTKAFGPGTSLRSATIEIVDEQVTTGIETKLKWLSDLNGRYLGGGSSSSSAPFGLTGLDFRIGW